MRRQHKVVWLATLCFVTEFCLADQSAANEQVTPLRARVEVDPQPLEARFPPARVTRLEPRVHTPVQVIAPQSKKRVPQAPAKPRSQAQFLAQFWEYLANSRSRYTRWGTIPRHSTAAESLPGSPHGELGQLYANIVVRVNPQLAMHGSILVREEYDPVRAQVRRVNVMYRARQYDQQHFDWYWIQYLPSGQVASIQQDDGESRPAVGRVAHCIACHRQAEGNDLLFSNDPGIASELDNQRLIETFKLPVR